MKIQAAPARHFDWLRLRSGYWPGSDFRAIEAVTDAGRVVGMVGFDGWTPNAVHMHVAVDSPSGCRGLVYAAFEYVFLQQHKQLALARIPANNRKSLVLARALGFRAVHRIRGGWTPDVEMVLLELRRVDCRWLPLPTQKAGVA